MSQRGMLEPIRELVESKGVDVNHTDKDNITCLHWAAINNRLPLVKSVSEKGGSGEGGRAGRWVDAWCRARLLILGIFRYLLSKGAKVDSPGGELVATPLQWAVRCVCRGMGWGKTGEGVEEGELHDSPSSISNLLSLASGHADKATWRLWWS